MVQNFIVPIRGHLGDFAAALVGVRLDSHLRDSASAASTRTSRFPWLRSLVPASTRDYATLLRHPSASATIRAAATLALASTRMARLRRQRSAAPASTHVSGMLSRRPVGGRGGREHPCRRGETMGRWPVLRRRSFATAVAHRLANALGRPQNNIATENRESKPHPTYSGREAHPCHTCAGGRVHASPKSLASRGGALALGDGATSESGVVLSTCATRSSGHEDEADSALSTALFSVPPASRHPGKVGSGAPVPVRVRALSVLLRTGRSQAGAFAGVMQTRPPHQRSLYVCAQARGYARGGTPRCPPTRRRAWRFSRTYSGRVVGPRCVAMAALTVRPISCASLSCGIRLPSPP